MNLIIAGSRDFTDYDVLEREVYKFINMNKALPKDILIISGTARGADRLGELFAYNHGISFIRMPADWNKHGKAAGYVRNREMAQVATHCIVFWDGKSKGTKNMIDIAKDANLSLYISMYDI